MLRHLDRTDSVATIHPNFCWLLLKDCPDRPRGVRAARGNVSVRHVCPLRAWKKPCLLWSNAERLNAIVTPVSVTQKPPNSEKVGPLADIELRLADVFDYMFDE